jgi:hypothetical protein
LGRGTISVQASALGRRFLAVDLSQEWAELLRTEGAGYATAALAAIKHEFPAAIHHTMTKPGDFPYRPRARAPVFYGSFDWHSSVRMHWALLRLMRRAPAVVPAGRIRAVLSAQFTPVAVAAEAEFIAGPDGVTECPQGWGWALALIHEAATWDHPDGQKWAATLSPLAGALVRRFLGWLPDQVYPVRYGTERGSAFALSLAWPFAQAQAAAGDPALAEAIATRAAAWFSADMMYPGDWEPLGHDCLSPALTEAELMSRVLPARDFADWLTMFLPGIEWGRPASLFTPTAAGGAGDAAEPEAGASRTVAAAEAGAHGQDEQLHGLNATRAWCWRRIGQCLPPGDPRAEPAAAAARQHAKAVLPYVLGRGYQLEHWLPGYAVLMLS